MDEYADELHSPGDEEIWVYNEHDLIFIVLKEF